VSKEEKQPSFDVEGSAPTSSLIHLPDTQPESPAVPSPVEPAAVPDTESILRVLRESEDPRGLKATEIVVRLRGTAKTRHRIRRLMGELVEDGVIERGPGGRYFIVGLHLSPSAAPATAAAPPAQPASDDKAPSRGSPLTGVIGRILVHPAGYGFVEREDGDDNIFIAARYRGGALDRDRVLVKTWLGYRGPEGRVVEVLQRGRAKLTGTLTLAGRSVVLEPDDPRISGPVLLSGQIDPAHLGQAVVAEIIEYPSEASARVRARVLRVLGDPDDTRTEVQKILECDDIPDAFPLAVVAEAERAPQSVGAADLADRVDLRHLPMLTIDPETARDFDDAVCVEDGPSADTTRLWVAVADVSHYVRAGSALAVEAERRGVSVYLPDRAIPMLPYQLSSGICSLNPEVERLAMVARLDIDRGGRVVGEQFMAAVIRSHARLDYAGVAAALAGDLRGPRARYAPYLPALGRMMELADRLRAVRKRRGSLDFDLPEAQVILDQDDPRRVRTVRRSRADAAVKQAYMMVEDFMLAANEAAARYFSARGLPTLWRIHAPPRRESLERLSELARSFGLALDPAATPLVLRQFLATVQGLPTERALSFLLLRALKQAAYAVDNVGHFGLAASEYLHFTSPIRRYPDLIVHRLMKQQLKREGQPAGLAGEAAAAPVSLDELRLWATESSARERRAMEVERAVVDMYRVFLMRDRIGEELDGTISGITGTGLFIEMDDPYVEGMVRLDSLPEPFELDEHSVHVRAERSGQQLGLGDRVRVRIDSVSVPRRRIELGLVAVLSATAKPVYQLGRAAPTKKARQR
jgi:ribonuclease R